MAKVLFIVPAYNEELNVGAVIERLRSAYPEADVVVINDGSTDATAAVVRRHGVALLDLPFNLGIGGAVQSGLLYAKRGGYDVAVQIDGDGQHDAAEAGKLIDRALSGSCDVAIGSRFVEKTSYRAPLGRRTGIATFAIVNRMILGQRIEDSTSGFRAFNRAAILFLSEDYPHDFPEPESIITLVRNGFRVTEVPVQMHQRSAGRSSITFLRSIYYMAKVLLAILIGATRKRRITTGGQAMQGEPR